MEREKRELTGKERAISAFNLIHTDRIPCCEVFEHPEMIRKYSGMDPYLTPAEAMIEASAKLGIDWLIDFPRQAIKFDTNNSTKTLDDGRKVTEWGLGGSEWEDPTVFNDADEVLNYRPIEDKEEKVRVVGKKYRQQRMEGPRESRKIAGDRVFISGLYYTTLFQFGIMAFGWENFLQAAAIDPETFGIILDQFTEISIQNVNEWIKDDSPVFFCHDDIAMTRGLVFRPEWYRKEIFPRYEKIFDPVKKANKKLIFVSDGNYSELIPDLFSLGIDGIMIDAYNDLDWVLKNFGETHSITGNIDTMILTSGTLDDIKREVLRCAELGKRYPGYFIKSAGDLPHNIPMKNIEYYFQLKSELCNK
jgi:hypothetical protein